VDEREALRYEERHASSMDIALSLASRSGAANDVCRRVWDALIRSRALVLDEMATRHRSVLRSGSADLTGLAEHVSVSRSTLANLVLRGPRSTTPKTFAAAVESARKELEQAELALAQKSAEFRHQVDQRNAGYDQVRDALPTGSALVAFRRYSRRNYGRPGQDGTAS